MHVEIDHERFARRYDIPSITQLLPVRTIRLHTKKIAEKSINRHLLYTIEKTITAMEASPRPHIRRQHDTPYLITRKYSGISFYLHVPESMKSKSRLELHL